MKTHKKLTIWTCAIYLAAFAIFAAIFWIKGVSNIFYISVFDTFLVHIMLVAMMLSLVNSAVRGISAFTFVAPFAFGLGTGLYNFLTYDLYLAFESSRSTFEYAIAITVVCLIFSVVGIWVHYIIKYLSDIKKLNRIMWISYSGLLIFSILIFRYCISGDGSGAWTYAFVVAIGLLTLLPAALTLICAIKHGACLSVLIMPVAFFVGAFINTFLTWNLHWYLCGSIDPFRIQWYYSLLPLVATSTALAIGLGVHYAVKYIKRSRAVV